MYPVIKPDLIGSIFTKGKGGDCNGSKKEKEEEVVGKSRLNRESVTN